VVRTRAAAAKVALILTLLLSAGLLAAQHHPFLGDFGDDAEFLILGQGLAAGHGYAWINSPDHPAHNRYPPGYPVLLAATFVAARTVSDTMTAVLAAKVVTASTFLATLALLWAFGRRRLSFPWTVGAVALFALNPAALHFAAQVMSDVPYLPFLLGAVLWAESIRNRRDLRAWMVLGLLLAAGAYMRSIGLAAAAGVLGWVWLTRPRTAAVTASAAFMVVMLPWWLRDAALSGGWRYLEELSAASYANPTEGTISADGLFARAVDNATFFLGKLGSRGVAGAGASAIGAVLLLTGARRSARQWGGAAEWAAAAICVSVLFWPIKTGRYILPVFPLAGVYVLLGIVELRRLAASHSTWNTRTGRGWRLGVPQAVSALGAAGLVLVCVWLAWMSVRQSGANLRALQRGPDPASYYAEWPDWARYLEAARWLRENTDPADVALARRHFALYVYSGRSTEKYRFDESEAEITYLTSGTARKFVVEDSFAYLRGEFGPLPLALRARGGDLILRYETGVPAARVWELVRPPVQSVAR